MSTNLFDVKNESVPRKTAFLFLVLDNSGSMTGTPIGAVNSAVEEVLLKIKDMNDSNADVCVEVALLAFNSKPDWITKNGPMMPENIPFIPLSATGGTNMGLAFDELEKKLHQSGGWLVRPSGSRAPVIILMTDGEPLDDWSASLDRLKQNDWFRAGTKLGFAVGGEADFNVLEQFTGCPRNESIIHVSDGDVATKLANLIVFLAVKSAEISSTPIDATAAGAQAQMAEVVEQINDGEWDMSGTGW